VTHKWHEIADTLAAAMQHSEGGVCTLTENEHAALAVYVEAQRPGRRMSRTMFGLTGGLDAFNHVDHAPEPAFVIEADPS
jgi:hypothetical protein